jgi:hypothetical protein
VFGDIMGKQPIQEHYIPRMYLKRFTDDKGRICVYKTCHHEILDNQSIDNYAHERYFYDTYDNQFAKDALLLTK